MVFLISEGDRAKANNAETFEMPFRGLWNEAFHQPIFSVNNLTATIQFYNDQPFVGGLTMRIDFVQGGVNTFLPVFNNVLRATRIQLDAEGRRADDIPPEPIAEHPPLAADLLPDANMAFVDPNDPSRIYTTQPVGSNDDRRSDAPTWSVSGEGLRRRRGE